MHDPEEKIVDAPDGVGEEVDDGYSEADLRWQADREAAIYEQYMGGDPL